MDEEPIRIPVTDVFDLHSVPDRDVHDIVEAYLEEARELGFRYVRLHSRTRNWGAAGDGAHHAGAV